MNTKGLCASGTTETIANIKKIMLAGSCLLGIQFVAIVTAVVMLHNISPYFSQYMDYEDEVRQSSNYSKHASQIMQVASLVCAKCLKDDPSRINLITHKCFQVSLHSNEPRVGVEWAASSKCLKQVRSDGSSTPKASIRPIPRAFFRGEFVLCDRGRRCKGERCTFPHSVEERDVWNAEKFGSKCTSAMPTKFYGNWFMFYLYRTLRNNAPS